MTDGLLTEPEAAREAKRRYQREWQRKRYAERGRLGKKVSVSCGWCGQTYEATACQVRAGRKFCSHSCCALHMKANGTLTGLTHRWTKEEAAVVSRLGGLASGGHNRIEEPYWRRHPERQRAHQMVKRHIAKGRLIPQPCEQCQSSEQIHAHHDDYSQPLKVRWLCAVCHVRHHHLERSK